MKSAAEIAYVAIGSNLGNREAIFAAVIRAITAEPDLRLCAVSEVFETDPIGPGPQGPYLNAVFRLETGLSAPALMQALLEIEADLGRDRSERAERWGARRVDLDLLFFGKQCIDMPGLVVPHPRAHERAFVMVPMAALAPTFLHPIHGRSMRSLMDSLPRCDSVRAWPAPPGWPVPPIGV